LASSIIGVSDAPSTVKPRSSNHAINFRAIATRVAGEPVEQCFNAGVGCHVGSRLHFAAGGHKPPSATSAKRGHRIGGAPWPALMSRYDVGAI
jgi:hypothetical protein